MNATIGRYIPGNTIVHKTNPIIKLMINIAFIVFVFLIESFILLSIMWVIAILLFLIANLHKKQLFSVLLTTLIIGAFIFVFNIFIIDEGYGATDASFGGKRIDYSKNSNDGYIFTTIKWWNIQITDKATFQTLFIMIRIYTMITITTIMTATTKPRALTSAIEILLKPLKLLFVPVHIIAMIISIALRFIPTLLEEAYRIMKAQASRGVDFKNGNLKTKSKAMITLIIPLFISAFSKAEDLSNAMETRGYDPYEKRTQYRKYPLRISDIFILILMIGILIFIIFLKTNIIPKPFWWM